MVTQRGIVNSVSGEGDKMDVLFPAISENGWDVIALTLSLIHICTIVVYSAWMLLFALPALGVSGANTGIVALILSVVIAIFGPVSALSLIHIYIIR